MNDTINKLCDILKAQDKVKYLTYLIIFERHKVRIYLSTLGIERKLEGIEEKILIDSLKKLLNSLQNLEMWREDKLKKQGKI